MHLALPSLSSEFTVKAAASTFGQTGFPGFYVVTGKECELFHLRLTLSAPLPSINFHCHNFTRLFLWESYDRLLHYRFPGQVLAHWLPLFQSAVIRTLDKSTGIHEVCVMCLLFLLIRISASISRFCCAWSPSSIFSFCKTELKISRMKFWVLYYKKKRWKRGIMHSKSEKLKRKFETN